jgi:hypothetical protein
MVEDASAKNALAALSLSVKDFVSKAINDARAKSAAMDREEERRVQSSIRSTASQADNCRP